MRTSDRTAARTATAAGDNACPHLSLPLAQVADLQIIVSLGFDGLSIECWAGPSFLARLIFSMLVPVALAGFACAIYLAHTLVQRRLSGQQPAAPGKPAERIRAVELEVSLVLVVEGVLPSVLRILFLAYPTVTNIAFDAFACLSLDADTADASHWLIADLTLRCWSPHHELVRRVAWVAVVLYPLGCIALTAGILFGARAAILSQQSTPLSRSTEFVHRGFAPAYFWWEVGRRRRTHIEHTRPNPHGPV